MTDSVTSRRSYTYTSKSKGCNVGIGLHRYIGWALRVSDFQQQLSIFLVWLVSRKVSLCVEWLIPGWRPAVMSRRLTVHWRKSCREAWEIILDKITVKLNKTWWLKHPLDMLCEKYMICKPGFGKSGNTNKQARWINHLNPNCLGWNLVETLNARHKMQFPSKKNWHIRSRLVHKKVWN